ncbi:flagellar biosynthesis protein FlgA [Desertihabitans brevis]|uniref:Flagellar biosynthesis protein FlgA n=1 Tax=Desertihabitans brevis TaxID=2268447 RepID=A0A367YX50_9ACTN|nr:SAF domain-containing protein [Desertihabitans brevis]RCK70444.1 flagellar biosynthesis protein FlgA [Desertihabitans brevis]
MPGPPERRAPDVASLERGQHQLRARRSPRWIAAGVLAICLGGIGAVLLYNGAVTSEQVLRVNSAVARGEVVEAGDLGPVTVGSLPGVSTVPAEQLDELVGQHALVDLPAGSLVPAGGVGAPAVAEGTVRMGLSLAPGRLPSQTLTPGDRVLLVPVPGPDDSSSDLGSAVPAVLDSAPETAPDGVASLVDVTVDSAASERVARLAATDRLVLVRAG